MGSPGEYIHSLHDLACHGHGVRSGRPGATPVLSAETEGPPPSGFLQGLPVLQADLILGLVLQ